MDELREKVIRGMECSICPNAACGDCGYFIRYENVPETGYCDRDAIYRDALSLLKAQEPRVMTLEEAVDDYSGVVYYESIYSSIVLAGYPESIRNGRCEFATIGSEDTEKDMLSDYGKTWRCWTSWPTDEQRKMVKWDDESGSD